MRAAPSFAEPCMKKRSGWFFVLALCACAETSPEPPPDDPLTSSQLDGGNPSPSEPTEPERACDRTPYCAETRMAAVCKEGVTWQRPCRGGRTCNQGRCGACTDDGSCRRISYRCRCVDGHEITGEANSTCTDSQGSSFWCSVPNLATLSLCSTRGGPDETFGHMGTGCVSEVDPL
jgi:hypothetical protein